MMISLVMLLLQEVLPPALPQGDVPALKPTTGVG